jgi:TonB-dependent SusC/RagA subfamily outer membrane receptor
MNINLNFYLLKKKGDPIMKNTRLKLFLTVLLSCSVVFFAYGQKKAHKERADKLYESGELYKIEGTVTAFNNYVVKNAEVTARNTKSRALTDSQGRFEILATKGDVLIFSANGFENNRRKVKTAEDEFQVNMIFKQGERNEEIAIGYGHLSVSELTHAMAHYRDLNADYLRYTDIRDLLQRELPGSRVSDRPGIKVFIRGGDNFNNRGFEGDPGAALFVLHGIVVPNIDHLQPRDVKSITLLKDAGALFYGVGGSNGVILIDTK